MDYEGEFTSEKKEKKVLLFPLQHDAALDLFVIITVPVFLIKYLC